ncbi:unnamed protein product [Clonostachys solani]|uniref:Uncharacterized protein n=1 Tax=Clonostachys solani TaxID=160281 RepID=A0A9N9Z6B1_9HYPO|nr:unnamed protein product [Clonostachys solani]
MYASTRRLLALSALLPTIAGLPYRALQPRAALTADKPKYSVVPLIPDENDNHNGGGNGNGNGGDNPSNGVVTVSLTVTKSGDTVTQTAEPTTVTQVVPTTIISVIDLDDDVTTTVYVVPSVAPPAPSVEPTTTSSTTSSTSTSSSTSSSTGCGTQRSTDYHRNFHLYGGSHTTQQFSAHCHCVLPPSGNSHHISSYHTGNDQYRAFIGPAQ